MFKVPSRISGSLRRRSRIQNQRWRQWLHCQSQKSYGYEKTLHRSNRVSQHFSCQIEKKSKEYVSGIDPDCELVQERDTKIGRFFKVNYGKF